MTDKPRYLLLLLPILCIVAWSACTTDRQPCLTPKIAGLNLKTRRATSATDTTAIDTALPSAVFVALTATGAKGTIYGTPQSAFTISLSSVADSCQWAFTTDTASLATRPFDTLTFYYKRNLQFISNACGFAYFYTLTKARSTNHIIDSLRITNTSVTNNVNTSHLQVYIHDGF